MWIELVAFFFLRGPSLASLFKNDVGKKVRRSGEVVVCQKTDDFTQSKKVHSLLG